MKKDNLDLPGMRVVQSSASWFSRIGAFLIDLLILNFIVLVPLQDIFSHLIPNPTMAAVESAPDAIIQVVGLILFFASALMFAYFVLFEYALGQTPGKMLFRIRVEGKSGLPGFWSCALRSLFIFPFFPFVLIWIIDPAYAAFNKDRTRLTEMLAKTKTVQDVHI